MKKESKEEIMEETILLVCSLCKEVTSYQIRIYTSLRVPSNSTETQSLISFPYPRVAPLASFKEQMENCSFVKVTFQCGVSC